MIAKKMDRWKAGIFSTSKSLAIFDFIVPPSTMVSIEN